MIPPVAICLAVAAAVGVGAAAGESGVSRLFILSGQSNMAGLDPEDSFRPAVEAAFPGDDIVIVKSAQGGQPIRRWYKKWRVPKGVEMNKREAGLPIGDLYDEELMPAIRQATKEREFVSVCFVWMQGERDAKTGLAAVYRESLEGLIAQLRNDLQRLDMAVVIGRLSDHRMHEAQWRLVRMAQVAVAEADSQAEWVDTDDLNGDNDDLHYTKAGYETLGKRFAEKAIALCRQ